MTEYSHLTDDELRDYYNHVLHIAKFHISYGVGTYKRCGAIEAEIQRRVSE